LPERTYLNDWMKVKDIIKFFSDFYSDFDIDKAIKMLKDLNIDTEEKLKTMSKGTKEKVQLILVMSRKAELYILDEPIGGVDPAARSYILKTILQNYNEDSTLLIATHLISEIENICDEIIFLSYGDIVLQGNVEEIKEEKGKSIDALFIIPGINSPKTLCKIDSTTIIAINAVNATNFLCLLNAGN